MNSRIRYRRPSTQALIAFGICASLYSVPTFALAETTPAADESVTPVVATVEVTAASDEQAAPAETVDTQAAAETTDNTKQTLAPDSTPTADAASTEVSDAAQAADDASADATDASQAPATETGNMTASAKRAPAKAPAAPEEATDTVPQRTIADGTYVFETVLNDRQVLDVSGGSKASGANVQTYAYNGSNAQKWNVTYDAKTGYYKIASANNPDNVLDVQWGHTASGTNVQVFKSNDTDSQRWLFVRKGDAYALISKLRDDLALDVSGGKCSNGTNMQVWNANSTAAQLFRLLDVNPKVASSDVFVADGSYVITSGGNASYVIDISNNSWSSGANAQIYARNDSLAQRYYFKRDAEGYYTITSIGSGKVLDVSGGSILPTANVQQYTGNGTDAQRWAIHQNANGSYSFVNKGTGLYLDVSGGKLANGSNVQGFRGNGTAAQTFRLASINPLLDKTIYSIHSFADFNKVLDISNGSHSSGASVQLYQSNGTLAQRYELVANSDGTYRIRTAASGGWLTSDAGGSKVTQQGNHATTASSADSWKLVWSNGFFDLVNLGSNKALAASGSTITANQAVSGSTAQHFLFRPAQLIANGIYQIASAANTRYVVDIASGSQAGGANVQVYQNNGSNAQKFIVSYSNGSYTIENANSGQLLDVTGAGKADGVNVQQWYRNGNNAQAWRAEIADGGYITFVNVSSGKALDVSGGKAFNGANMQQYTSNNTNAQKWTLVATSIRGWILRGGKYTFYFSNGSHADFGENTYAAYQQLSRSSSSTGWYATIDNNRCYVNIFKWSSSGWEPSKSYLCGPGTPTLGSTFRGISHVLKKGAVMGWDPMEYYWTEFYNNGADPYGEGQRFHSILYYKTSWFPGPVYDGTLGRQVSHGCVRLALENAKWIYDNLPIGTTVISF